VTDEWNAIKAHILNLLHCFEVIPEHTEWQVSRAGIYSTDIAVDTRLYCDTLDLPLSRVPVTYHLSNNLNAFARKTKFSDKAGRTENNIISIYEELPSYVVTCAINVKSYIKRFGDYTILNNDEFEKIHPECNMVVHIKPVIVMIETEEQIFGNERNQTDIRDYLADFFSENNYIITDDRRKADYLFNLKGNTTKGSVYDGVFTAYLTITYELISLDNKLVIKQGTLPGIKGAGLDFESAADQAYRNAPDKMQSAFRRKLLPALR
jgi:hypothetical protein